MPTRLKNSYLITVDWIHPATHPLKVFDFPFSPLPRHHHAITPPPYIDTTGV